MACHLDEVNRDAEARERQLLRERQIRYRQELEDQRAEIATRLMMSKNAVSEKEKESARKEADFANLAAERDVRKEVEKRVQAVNITDENMRNKQKVIEKSKAEEQREDAEMCENMKRVEEEERTRERTEKVNRGRIAQALKESYHVQEDLLRQKADRLRALDRVYVEQYAEKLNRDDKDRQRVPVSLCNVDIVL